MCTEVSAAFEVGEDDGPFGRPAELMPAGLGLAVEMGALKGPNQHRSACLGKAFILDGGSNGTQGAFSKDVGLEPLVG